MRLALDAHLSPRHLAIPLERRGHDVLALQADLRHRILSDSEIVDLCSEEERIVVTCDHVDSARIARHLGSAEQRHHGMILIRTCRSHEFGQILRGLDHVLEQWPAQEQWLDLAVYL